jgi:hypothetical protein
VLNLVEKLDSLLKIQVGKNQKRKEPPHEESNTNWNEKEAESNTPGNGTYEQPQTVAGAEECG